MNKILRIFITAIILFSFTKTFAQCNYSIVLFDTFGDGWNGGQVTLLVGTTTYGPYTITNGGGPLTYNFMVNTGDQIHVTFTAGNWPEENEYFIYDSDGIEIFHDGPNPTASNTLVGTGTCPSCPAPGSLSASNITLNSASLNWNELASATQWNKQYGPFGFTLGTGTIVSGITTKPYSLSGLTAATSYDFYVQSYCGSGDTSSWAGPFSFSTPVCQPSEQCGYIMDMHDLGNSWNGANITVLQNGIPMGSFTVTGGGANLDTVWLCSAANISLVWASGMYDNETIFQMLDPYGVVVFSWTSGNAPAAGIFHTFTSYCDPQTCPATNGLSVTNITDVSAILNWNEVGTATTWQIEYGLFGFTHGTGTLLNGVTSNPYVISSLSDYTSYSFYVRSVCSPGDTSLWTGPLSFTTLLGAFPNPTPCEIQVHIPDGGCIDIPINVSGIGTQLGTDVLLSDFRFIVKHTWDGDISATLRSPNGVNVSLAYNNGGNGDNFGIINGLCNSYTNFNMTGVNGPITSGVAPFVGSYVPLGNFNDFNDDSDPNGQWILHICDLMTTDTGSVQFIQLVFEPIIPPATVLINELDCDQVGNDSLEFVELYDGGVGNYPLDQYTVVFFNGSTDQCYMSFDLDGYTTDSAGYFVIGNSDVPGVSLVFANNLLQNGADAVALFVDSAATFPAGTLITLTNLVDALVYETADPTDIQLLALLNTGQPQIDEDLYVNKDIASCSRIPNGSGGLRNTYTYLPAPPTPKAVNRAMPSLVWQSSVFTESLNNDGSAPDVLYFKLNHLLFSSVGSFTDGVEYVVANVPAGLTAVLTTLTDTTGTLTLTGNALSHLNADDVNNLTVTFQDAAYNGLTSNFVIGNSKNNIVVDFFDTTPLTLTWDNTIFIESASNDGSVTGSINLTLYSETFILNSGIFLPSSHYVATNVPAGLTLQIESTSDTSAIISLSGNALNHTLADDINNMSVVFQDAAFTGGSATAVAGYRNDSLEIHYLDPYVMDLSSTIIPSPTIYICNNCPCNSPDIYIHNNGPDTLRLNDTIYTFYQHAPLPGTVQDTIILGSDLAPGDSVLYEPVLDVTQMGVYNLIFYTSCSGDVLSSNDTATATIYAYEVTMDMGGFNDTIVTYSYPHSLMAGLISSPFPYSYLWSDGTSGQTISVMADGWYSVTVTDSIGCSAYDSVYIYLNQTLLDLAITIDPSDTAYVCNNCQSNYPSFLIINYGPNNAYLGDTIFITWSCSCDSLYNNVIDTVVLSADLVPGDTLNYYPVMNIDLAGIYQIGASFYTYYDNLDSNNAAFSTINSYQLAVSLGGVNDTLTIVSFPHTIDAGICTSPLGCNYIWSNSDITQITQVNTEGWIGVTVSDSNGCSVYDSVYVMVNPDLTDLSIEIPVDTFYVCNNCPCNYPSVSIINNGPHNILQNDTIFVYNLHAPLSFPIKDTLVLTSDFNVGDTISFVPGLDITQNGQYPVNFFINHPDNFIETNDTCHSNIFAYQIIVDLGGVNDSIEVTDWPWALFAGNCTSPFTCHYLWSTGVVINVIGVMANDWYGLTVTDDYGCVASDSVYVYKSDGISDVSGLNGIKVYPNPAKDKVTIEINSKNFGDATISLYSINGVLLNEKKNEGQLFTKETFDISGIASGIYYLRIATDDGISFVKLVVE